ncbi:mitochondrial fission factor-like isoform X4 [Gadus macrocephalus]|uniref:mitochondrial fission factor-like isoform X4 n=1 Tax=Gadus macrocephalus TaxID=80720 RepID=UPI0028CB148F|nr:mitochondrial fission factor-like isoform X4 [Gadus macrocephalus]
MASFSPYLAEAMHVPGRDRGFSESINHNMQVPDRLAVGGGQPSARGREEEAESRRRSKEPPASYNMHIPDRLTYTEAPDLSPRPQFTSSKPANSTPLTLETCWEHQTYREGEFFHGEPLHSPMRRSYSDQGLGRTPPGTPTHLKHVGALHVHLASPATESWSQDDEGGAVVEFIVLRRQVLKMSRRLAGLERQNTERRNTEALLFSLLLSACLLNGWLWIRR